MEKLTFTFDNQLGYVSSSFDGGVAVQCVFPDNAKHVGFLESRLGSDLPWTSVKGLVLQPKSVFNIIRAATGQEYRIRCEVQPTSVTISKLTGTAGTTIPSSPSDSDEEILAGLTKEDFDGIGEEASRDIVAEAIAEAEKNGGKQP